MTQRVSTRYDNDLASTVNPTKVQRLTSEDDIRVLSSFSDELTENFFVESMAEKLIEKEQTKEGRVKWQIYWYYIKAGGILLWLVIITFNFLYQLLSALANFWLTYWSSDPAVATMKYYYLRGYLEYAIGIAISVILASLSLNFAVLNASSRLHENLLQKVMYWRAYIFDITPIGQILNRFSYDVDVADNSLLFTFKQMANVGGMVLSTLCVIVYSSPIFVVALIPLALVYSFIQQIYVNFTRQLKRLESASRSPVYSYFNETITGAPVIRAYRAVEKFIGESEERMLKNQICAYTSLWGFKWICFRLDGLANLIILMVTMLAVTYRGTQKSGVLSLSITYALQLTRSLTWVIRAASDIESNVVSIERIQEFENIPVEELDSPKYRKIPPNWPSKGVVVFEGYKARYREGLDFVLRGLNIRIESGEKIGVVGRTGAGKSSLSLAIFRIFEAAEGRIIIDGIDVSEIRLNVLRSRITIIPQDPVLFSGTVRQNLDPFFEYNDQQLWRTLEMAHLKNFISSLSEGLGYEITENGGNLSIGQRQLICLARALLRKTKILVLDEATAAIDLETDELIQKTIREEFKECTVLTIAHKLNTVLDSDRIMVLDRGLVKEFDSPAHLLEAKNSIFYSMAKEAGLVT